MELYLLLFSFLHLLLTANASLDCDKFADAYANQLQALVAFLELLVPALNDSSILSNPSMQGFNINAYSNNVTNAIDAINSATGPNADELHTELAQACSEYTNTSDANVRRGHAGRRQGPADGLLGPLGPLLNLLIGPDGLVSQILHGLDFYLSEGVGPVLNPLLSPLLPFLDPSAVE